MTTKTFSPDSPTIQTRAFIKSLTCSNIPVVKVGEVLSLGRGKNNAMQLQDPYISTRHCRIEFKKGKYYLFDLRSRNGTFLNGSAIVEAPLKDMDRISLGQQKFLFSYKFDSQNKRFITSSKNIEWNKTLENLEAFARSQFPILLSGPSGSGKEILAQEIHRLSNREPDRMVCVNCSAFSENLIESELFGHVKGSFTGAQNDRLGAFESARGGTLFLDEIGDLPKNLQPKLLRALESSEIRPIGSDRTIKTDVRVLAATHRNLKKKILDGEFREDLFFRLNVLNVCIPPLQQRKEDIVDLIYLFARKYQVSFKQDAIKILKNYEWPGNIRELRNFVAKSSVLYNKNYLSAKNVCDLLDANGPGQHPRIQYGKIKNVEKNLIKQALFLNNGNQRKASQQLGMAKSTLHDKIKSYEINIDEVLESI